MTRPRQDQRLLLRHRVLSSRISASQGYFPFHSRLVTGAESEIVTVDQKVAVFHFTLCSSLYSARAFHEPVQENIVGHQTDISKWVVGFEFDQFLGCLEPDFVFAGAVGNPPASE